MGVAPGVPWSHILPGCRSVWVIGSGGMQLWDAFVADLRAAPHKAERADPLDGFVRDLLAAADPDPPPSRRWVRCAIDSDCFVDFRRLAYEAGLGWPSPLGLVLNPQHGPWLGLRLACFSTDEWAPTPLSSTGPCKGCHAPCQSACPASAVSPGGLRLSACLQAREEAGCLGGCFSRSACPIGQAYSSMAHRYHQDPAARRQILEALLAEGGGA